MSVFASAVGAVIEHLEETGHDILEAAFEEHFTPHVVAQADGHLVFALVVAIDGPHVRDLDDAVFDAEILPRVRSTTRHDKAPAVADLAASHGGQAGMFVVCVLPTSRLDEQGAPVHMARVFPFLAIDEAGAVITAGNVN